MVYDRMACITPGKASVTESEFIIAQRRDYGVFGKIDTTGKGEITLQEWSTWLRTKHTEKRGQKRGSGDTWLKALLKGFELGMDEFDVEHAHETEEDAAAREGPTEVLMHMARTVHERVVALSETRGKGVSKEALARAGNSAIYGDVLAYSQTEAGLREGRGLSEVDGQACIPVVTWLAYLEHAHRSKHKNQRGSGDAWLRGVLQALSISQEEQQQRQHLLASRLEAKLALEAIEAEESERLQHEQEALIQQIEVEMEAQQRELEEALAAENLAASRVQARLKGNALRSQVWSQVKSSMRLLSGVLGRGARVRVGDLGTRYNAAAARVQSAVVGSEVRVQVTDVHSAMAIAGSVLQSHVQGWQARGLLRALIQGCNAINGVVAGYETRLHLYMTRI